MAITQTFSQSTLSGTNLNNPTSLQVGPDGRLYVSQQNGIIKVYDISDVGGSLQASNEEIIDLVNNIPNHDDDGSLNTSVNNRQVTGIAVEGTAENPILYVTSSDPRIGAGGGGNDLGLDTNSGIISRLTWDGSQWQKVDLVIGLPRSEENHSTNGLDIRTESVEVAPGVFEDHQIMYVMSGGFTNKGAPSNNFTWTPEYYYAAALLRVDLTQLEQIEADEGVKGGTAYVDEYVYALPTLDDPTRPNTNGIDGDGAQDSAAGTTGPADAEAADTFGGNDGRNQAKFDLNGPVQVYSPGYRNAYDVVITEGGNIYTFDNGPNNNWGGDVVDENGSEVTSTTQVATNAPNLNDNTNDGDPDNLHIIEQGTYGGHPTPTRAAGAAAGLWSGQGNDLDNVQNADDLSEDVQLTPIDDPSNDPNTVWDDLPTDWDTITGGITNPIEGVYFGPDNNPGPKDESLFSIGSSSNGITEYTADNIGDGGSGTEYLAVVSFNGNLTIMEVQTDGTAAGSTVTDTESISIGGTPLDVTSLGNSGIPGSGGTAAGAMFIAQIGADNIIVLEPGDPPGVDLDADNDGVLDKDDPLQFDPDNGTQTILQGGQTLLWDFNPASPNPGPDGEYNIGFNGWMIDGVGEINPDVLIDNPGADLLTDLDNTIRGGAPGVIQVKQVTDGDAFTGNNTQNDAIQTGFTPAADVADFTIRVPIFNPYSSVGLDQNFGSVGFALGDGSQSNYLKVVAGVGGGVPRLQVLYEENDTVVNDITVNGGADADFNNAATNATGNAIFELYLKVDLSTPGAATAQAFYNYELTPGGGMELAQPKAIGGAIALEGEVLAAVLGQKTIGEGANELPSSAIVTLLSTSTGPETPFEANFVDLEITSTVQQVPPIAGDDETSTGIGEALNIPVADLLANDDDPNSGDTFSVTSASNPVNGTVALMDNNTPSDPIDDFVTFTPTPGFEGTASFEYTIIDSTNLTDTATVTVNVADTTLLYRVNAEQETITALPGSQYDPNGDVDWIGIGGVGAQSADGVSVNIGNISTHNIGGRATTGPYAVPDYVPQALFDKERWDPGSAPEMEWDFDAPTPGNYTVNLFMGNGFGGTSAPGQRVFDIEIEGILVEDDLDLSATLGHQVGGMFSYTVPVTDGNLDIDFLHVVENPLINAIEILGPAAPPAQPVVSILNTAPTVSEAGGTVQISIATDIQVPENETVDVTFEITPGTATPGVDYSYTGGTFNGTTYTDTLPIAGSSSDLTFNIDILQEIAGNEEEEPPETFTVTITDVSTNAQIGTASSTVTIQDDDVIVTPGEVVVRINAGGPEVAANDGGLPWSGDQGDVTNGSAATGPSSEFLVDRGIDGTNTATSDNVTYGDNTPIGPGVNNTGAPDNLFTTERFSSQDNPNNIGYAVPLPDGEYTVNLYFDELFFSAAGERIFDVEIENALVLDDFDTFAAYGNDTGVQSFTTTVSDGVLNIEFVKGAVNNPHIAAIEIVAADGTVYTPPLDDLFGTAVEISGDRLSPSNAGTLSPGDNPMSATQEGENGDNQFRDRDIFTFTIPDGFVLTGIELDSFANSNPVLADGFLGIQLGNQLTVDVETGVPDGTDGLLGGIIYNSSNIGEDLLDLMAQGGEIQPGFSLDPFDPALTGDVTVWLNQGAGPSTADLNFIVEEIQTQPGDVVAAINAGGLALTQDGIDFSADQFFNGGLTFTDGNAGNGPQSVFDGTVYETERYGGNPAGTNPLNYSIPVAPGEYTLELYFAEIFQSTSGDRVFDVFVEDQLVVDDLDILAETAGDINQPFIFNVPGTVSPDDFGATDAIDISFEASADNAKISGIVIRAADAVSDTPPEVAPIADLTIDEGQAASVNITATDVDLDAIALSAEVTNTSTSAIVDPAEYSLTDNGDGTGTFEWLTDEPDDGVYTVAITANAAGEQTTETFTLTVNEIADNDPVGAATLTVTLNSNNVQTSNFGNNSFQLTNVGDKDIEQITLDVTNALYPDSVFDPFGVAGDTIGKLLTINSGGSETGVAEPTGGYYIGAGGAAGFEALQLDFTDFNSGETLGFSVDMDPNSIAGATKSILDSGADPAWDIGGISGAELIGSTFTVTFTDGTQATGQLQGAGNQGGSQGLASQDSPNLGVSLTVNGLNPGGVGTYDENGPSVIINGPAGETARVVLTKGIIQPVNNNFTDSFAAQLDAQLAALAASDFPANNAIEFQTFDIPLTGSPIDISDLFDFTQVPGFDLAVDEAQVPLGFAASVVDFSDDGDGTNDLPIGPVTVPIYLQFESSLNAPPAIAPIDDLAVLEGDTATVNITATDAEDDAIALALEVINTATNTVVDPAEYTFTDDGDGTGTFEWLTDEPDDGVYTVNITASDTEGQTTETFTLTVNEDTTNNKAAALIEITPDGGLNASTFGGSTYQITNTGEPGVQITSVSFDLSTGILPDMVFDPIGSGGDATASAFTPNSGAAETGLVLPADPAVDPFSQPRNGGFDVLTIDFTDFDPDEQFFFTTDIDPNNIQGVPGAGNAGAVSGYELIGSTVTVTFSDGRILVGSLYEDGSLGGSQVLVDSEVTATAPTIELLDAGADESTLPGTQVTVSDVSQTVRVTGTPGEFVSLLQMDARLFIASGDDPFDVTADELPFYANEAMAGKTLYSGVIGTGGFADIPVTLLETDSGDTTPDGGLNHFVAVTSPTPYQVDLPVSQTSDVLIVKQREIPLVNGQPTTIFVDETDTVVGNAFQSGEQPYQGSLFSNTDGTATPDDVILGTVGPDNIWAGEEGNDLIAAAEGDNNIGIGTGNVDVTAGSGADFIYSVAGGGGSNIINLGEGDNEAYLEGGDNQLITGSGTDLIGIGSGNDTVSSGGGNDFVYSIGDVSDSTNTVDVGDGTNTVWLNGGDNTITSGAGDDSIGLGDGTDIVDAGDGNNIIYMIDPAGTTDGSKDILTGMGNDYVQTGSGDDSIDAGTGLNTLFGGDGADVFTMRSGAYNFIGDFEFGTDQIELESLTFADLIFFQGSESEAADVFIFVDSESIGQVANTTVAEISNSANFV